MNDFSINFSNQEYLLLLLLLPIFIFVGWPRSLYRRRRDIASLLIRLLLVTLIIFGLAGLELPRDADYLAVVFLVDVSDSINRTTQQAALDYVRDSIEQMDTSRDKAAVILFGANAVVEQPMSAALDLSQLGANPITLNTDLAEAIRLGLALFPPDTARRMVILSDGVETVGDAESAARLAEATSVQIDYVPLTKVSTQEEILVSNVVVPPRVNEEEIFDLTVTVQSEYDTSAELRVLAGGEIIHQEDVSLRAGENSFVIGPLSWPGQGFVDFRVQIEPQGSDNFYQNNELSAFTEVRGRPSVLLVAQDEREIEFLQPALEENGLLVNVV
ncbi:MAG: VWA domain-containing protein, partial [Anaerolineae bacterium]|nr:VWA domain-containing protein [Anaerolineae bacterium]